ncbi:hypothetical protein EKO27_g5136 [Xylaria grammica]|uniref:N-acetyltransferase domain-containing protein n=1 Tax=Xylaria grammica TaxID=363999 RepID=A0A439D6C8_9PEZI|nr:hypothetical protein EKO27_g5136 [Xylaria grammica]
MISGQSVLTPGNRGGPRHPQVTVIRDYQACIPFTRILAEGDIVLLLTPVVTPHEQNGSDPFEPFGRALATRHPWIRHVPYTARNGITNTHVAFIKRAKAVIFVISSPPNSKQSSQVEIAEVSQTVGDEKPHIVVACGNVQDFGLTEASFPTIIQSGSSPTDLHAVVAILFGECTGAGTSGVKVQELIMAPKHWPPEEWDGLDVTPVYNLWNHCLPDQFHLEKFPLQNLLQRDGYAMHFVVRLPETREIIGFCATYTTFVDKAGERLIGSLAMIIVKLANGGFSTVPSGLVFRQATFDDFQSVSDFIEKETARKDYTGWYDQYMNLAHDGRLNDIILGLDRSRIIAAALVYTPHDGSPLALDLPWARTIGPDVGGVTCICIADDNGAMTSSKDTIMIRLLDACIAVLREHGMQRVYLDAIKGGDEGFQSMGE